MEVGGNGGEGVSSDGNRLAEVLTNLTLEHPDRLQLDLTNFPTLRLALPTLLRRARGNAEAILTEPYKDTFFD